MHDASLANHTLIFFVHFLVHDVFVCLDFAVFLGVVIEGIRLGLVSADCISDWT